MKADGLTGVQESNWIKMDIQSKFNPDGTLLSKKARVVAKGYVQQEGVDFEDAYSPVARMKTIRMFFAIGAKRMWCIHQLDVKTAFLNGEIKEEVYVVQP